MAERRMFAKTIIDSDAFLDMPMSARLLYYDFSMRADDDGFVNSPKKITRFTGASDDDIKVLIGKRFIIPFDTGVVVIKHWRIHNYIRKDTYTETKYKAEKASLYLDENNAYSLHAPQLSQGRDEPVDEPSTQVRLGKDRLGKYIPPYNPPTGETPAPPKPDKKPTLSREQEARFQQFYTAYPRHIAVEAARKAWAKIKPDDALTEQIVAGVKRSIAKDKRFRDGYVPHPATWLNAREWENEYTGQPPRKGNAGNHSQRAYADISKVGARDLLEDV